MPDCPLCQGERFVRFGNGEDRPCSSCNADFYERERAAVETPKETEA